MKLVLIAIVSYLIGCFSAAYVISRITSEIDIREHGSGNSGSTNVLRVLGKKAALYTLVCDLLKGVLASYIGKYIGGDIGQVVAGVFVVVGHNWPVFLDFKGGKGVATSIGILLTINFKITLVCLIIWLLIVIVTNYVSLASISFLLSFPIIYYIIFRDIISEKYEYLILGVILFLLGVLRHKENIKRLISGTENKLRR